LPERAGRPAECGCVWATEPAAWTRASASSQMSMLPSGAPEPPNDDGQPSLLSAIIRRRKRVVLATALVAALGAAAFAAHQTKLYTATSSVAVQSPPGPSSTNAP